MNSHKTCFIFVLLFSLLPVHADELPGNRFVYAVLRHGSQWDPYGDLWPEISAQLVRTTSLQPWPERRVVTWEDPRLFESPFLLVAGRGSLDFSNDDISRLREYLESGGFLLLDDTAADGGGAFARSAAVLPARIAPSAAWRPVPPDHAVFRSFFLLKEASGRRRTGEPLKGLWVGGRLAAVYCSDDLHGAWVRAPAGGGLFPCEPGGELQRREAQELLINLVMFSVTGTYKTDAIHQEFIQRKLEAP